jgi:hypothetical protein
MTRHRNSEETTWQGAWNDRPGLELDTEPVDTDGGRSQALAAGTGAAGMASRETRLPGVQGRAALEMGRTSRQIDENLARSQARRDVREKRLAEDDDKPTIH